MKKVLIILTCVLLSITLISCTKYELIGEVDAVVIDVEYKESYTTSTVIPMFINKTVWMMPRVQHHPEEYYVVLQYEEITTTVDNQGLYEIVNIGDSVKVNHYKSDEKEKISYDK